MQMEEIAFTQLNCSQLFQGEIWSTNKNRKRKSVVHSYYSFYYTGNCIKDQSFTKFTSGIPCCRIAGTALLYKKINYFDESE